jgi:hypothetical protein
MTTKNDEKLVPKRIGGVKIPKKMRKGAEAFASLLTTPESRKIAADILIAVAGVLAASARPGQAAVDSGEKARKASSGTKTAHGESPMGNAARAATGAVVDVVSEAARHILPAARTGDRDPEVFDPSGDAPKRKKNRDRPSSH